MHKFITTILLCVVALTANSAHIGNIYISAKGNNGYEAKAKAEHLGRERVLMMLAGKFELLDIPDSIDFDDLVKVFVISDVIGEKITNTSYSATVSFKYSRVALNKLFIKYFPQSSSKKFANYLIFPVLKQGNKVRVWLKDNEWLKLWDKHKEALAHANLLYASEFHGLRQNVSGDNIFDQTYAGLVDMLPNILFKEVLIVVLEHYTADNGHGYVAVDYITLDDESRQDVYSENITIATQGDVVEVMNDIIENILYNYGDGYAGSTIQNIEQPLRNVATVISKPAFIMRAEFYNQEEQEELTRKLNNIKFIKKIEIKHDFGAKYSVALYTGLSEELLAQELYKNQLSYVKRGDSYLLINVINGV